MRSVGEAWRRIVEWLRRWRRRPAFLVHNEPWERIEHFDTGGMTGPTGTRTYVGEPLPYRATALRDRRGTASR